MFIDIVYFAVFIPGRGEEGFVETYKQGKIGKSWNCRMDQTLWFSLWGSGNTETERQDFTNFGNVLQVPDGYLDDELGHVSTIMGFLGRSSKPSQHMGKASTDFSLRHVLRILI